MSQVIRISDEIYSRLESHAVGFDTPQNIIEKLLDFYEANDGSPNQSLEANAPLKEAIHLDITYYPNDAQFKTDLLACKEAYIKLTKTDGTSEIKHWNASRFTEESSVNGNLRSGFLRDWRKKGICKAELSTYLEALA
ncbi:hypothetical protein HJ196_23105 [Vibrio parahaemolyticus]|uniref:hypothetical protein n=1 Tax=Vibrio parahaemolyticus TaxID=670 RepID=UPI00046EECBF|nr:hypothetical protein [Vibrio parahaemolyticus]ELB2083749.1 hypothetical protein [Vibrio parahaemolyticus]MBE3744936.1 hypothetical protein [Vibrio parahaemolyticus]TBT37310.1 hypothetical protein D5E81_24860 [Vibrio parahaemolyticus]